MRRTAPAVGAILLTTTLLLSGCGSSPTPASPTGTTSTTPPGDDAGSSTSPTTKDDTVLPPSDGPTSGPLQPSLPTNAVSPDVLARPEVQAAIADLAERQGVAADAVSVVGFTSVTWRDGSLGCPVPGRMYTQALVPGEQLVLKVGSGLYSYHAAKGKAFSYCANPQAPIPSTSS